MKKYIFLFASILCLMAVQPVEAQTHRTARSYIRSGNRAYKDSLFDRAELKYRKAVDLDAASVDAKYNLANALYYRLITDSVPGDQFTQLCQEIIDQYNAAGENETDKNVKAAVCHNLGNTYYLRGLYEIQTQQQTIKETYAACIDAYKNALRNNPADDETRYNLTKAKAIYNSIPPGQNDQNQQQQQDQQQQQQDQQQQPPQQQDQQDISKENAEQILQALMQDEKDLQEKVQKQDLPNKRKHEKDW